MATHSGQCLLIVECLLALDCRFPMAVREEGTALVHPGVLVL